MGTNPSLISLISVSENEAENGNDSRTISLIEVEESEGEEENQKYENIVQLKNMSRSVRNWRKCLACGEKKDLQRPSREMREFVCKSKQIYIQKNDRVCSFHAQRDNWDDIHFKESSNFSAKIIDEMVSLLTNMPRVNSDSPIDFGVTDIEFDKIIRELGLPENPNKKQQQIILAVRLFIDRLRNGHTFKQMGRRYNMTRRTIGKKIKYGRNLLLSHFVPNNLGHECRSRQWLHEHTTALARLLYCDNDPSKCVVVLDGTYIYTCNTSNHSHQRKIYSGQKHRHLFKIMKITAVDGSIIDCFGPFPATMNDANIIKKIFEKISFQNILNSGDTILVDRGFRDAVQFLTNKKYQVKIPEFIERGTNGQLTAMQANKSRLVTKMRFVIETANGRMKTKWSLFQKIIPSILTINLMSDYKIGAALLNAFSKPILCDKDDFLNIGSRMVASLHVKNPLARIINSKKFKKTQKKHFGTLEGRLNFPKLTQEQIKNISLGNYAIRQGISYVAEHKKMHGEFKISILPTDYAHDHFRKICRQKKMVNPIFIHANIKSRFRSQKKHEAYVLYDENAADINNILYYCKCQHGQRTAGCCSHVMAIVWYFGLGRYEQNKDPASHLNNFFDIPSLI